MIKKNQQPIATRLKKDDEVQIMLGKDRGKRGAILRIDREKGKVLVRGLNIVRKAKKAKSSQEKGQIVEIEAPLSISNVQIICKKCGPTRIGSKMENAKKERCCKKCGEIL